MTNFQEKILAIDDEPIILDLIKYNLENEEYSVDICTSAKEALNINLSIYNLILLDVDMDAANSIELTNLIKQNAKTTHTPIIILSENKSKHNVIDWLRLGADDYILKPLSMPRLLARVNSLIRRCSIGK